jgi:ATP-binding cassette subfamily C protein CydD
VLVIAHRLNTLKKASNIVLLDNGRIVQQGDYQSLSQQDGPFKTLLTSDMHEVENE